MEIIGEFETSVRKALGEINPGFEQLPGLVVCGTHAPNNLEAQAQFLRAAREDKVPTLAICWGLQMMGIEYFRNVKGIKDATTQEIGGGTLVVEKLKYLNVGIKDVRGRSESHWNHYAIPYERAQEMDDFDIVIGNEGVEEARLHSHPFYVGVQYHPEYQSSRKRPHPLLVEFLDICKSV